jgi:uncharacterized protein YraI
MRRSLRVATAAVFFALSTGTALAAPGVTEGDLNMRRGPGTGYEVITAIPAGAQVEVFDCASNWCEVSWNGYEGFSSRSYLDISSDAYSAGPPAVVAETPGFYDEPRHDGPSL